MLEDNKIHIQYSDGVSVDLDNPAFVDEKITQLYEYVLNLNGNQ